MKRTLLLICTLLCTNVLFAQTRFWVEDFQYQVTNSASLEVSVYNASSSITEAVIPDTVVYYGSITYTVTSISSSAFSGCNNLHTVTIPKTIKSIGSSAFQGCNNLTTLNFNAVNCEEFGSSYNDNYNPLKNCPITTINIGDSVQRIPSYFASNLDSLAFITIPENVTIIEGYAFRDCDNLTTLNFNAINCEAVNSSYLENCPITTINIGDSVQRIPSYFASNLDSLAFITIPESVTTIGSHAFDGCSSLTSVTIPNSVTSIGSYAFSYCSNLTTLNFNAINCADFDNYSNHFYYCPITTINIGESVQRIPAYFASNLDGLTSITIPNNVISIGNNAFDGCSSLTSITIPNSVTSIGESAFEDCSSLTLLNIGSGVNHIGRNAFAYCNFLLYVNCLAVNPPTIFDNTSFPYPNSASLTVPCGSLEAYSNPSNLWNAFFNNRIYENGFDVNVSSNNTLAGHVEIESNCELAVLTAIANSGYRFVNWSDGHTENPRIIELHGDTTLIANFDIIISGAELSATICEGASLNFGGINITNSGVYTQTFTAVNGSDSIVTLTVTVNPSYNIVIDTVLNEGDVYTENGFNESEIGTYVQYFQTIEGCDSIITLNILSSVSLLDVEYEEISFFPNPTKSEITFSQAIEKVEVIDLTGKTIFTFSNAKTINIESLPAGAYYLRLTNNSKAVMRKVFKE